MNTKKTPNSITAVRTKAVYLTAEKQIKLSTVKKNYENEVTKIHHATLQAIKLAKIKFEEDKKRIKEDRKHSNRQAKENRNIKIIEEKEKMKEDLKRVKISYKKDLAVVEEHYN